MIKLPKGQWKQQQGDFLHDKKHNNWLCALIIKIISLAGGIKKGFMTVFDVLLYIGGRLFAYITFFINIYARSKIQTEDKETLVARIAWRTGCRYEFVHHAEQLEKKHLSTETMTNVCVEDTSLIVDDKARLLATVADDMLDNYQVPREHLEKLREYYPDKLIVEITLFIGHYMMVAGFNNTLVNIEESKEYCFEGE